MIIEIALGIVLAVLILRFWPLILALGAVAIALAIALVVLALGLYWFAQDPQGAAMIVGVTVGVLLLSWALGWLIDKLSRSNLKSREALGYDATDDETRNTH